MSATVPRADVEAAASLAKLKLPAPALDRIAAEIEAMFAPDDELLRLDVSNVPPHPHHQSDTRKGTASLRLDTGPPNQLSAGPASFCSAVERGFFTVPADATHSAE